ncbi:ShlB/FhaC/HecB family hemolysin secretion/activation protein, partial [Paraburkholderia sp. C35]|uniref:ShlB/FhaC/HecB family hemolysin secretion/activation protein n=1 Tax=Paraburkholderia sp. C35 TaxID=2126993 RepID=UPI000D688D2A
MNISKRLAALPLSAVVTLASAQSIPSLADKAAAARANAEQNQQLQQQRDAQQREQTVNAPAVRSTAPNAGVYPELPHESPCFRIDTFTLDVPTTLPDVARKHGTSNLPLDPFWFGREWLDHYRGQCIGKAGLDILIKGLQQTILSRGYVTTRVLLPEQDLSTGTLKVALVPGVVRHLRFADPDTRGTWKSAFPSRDGDLLNVRDLEQGLEQMKRVASQDVDMKIEPTDAPGESDVILNIKRSKPWTFVVSTDNSGTKSTGKWQGNVSLGIDNPLGLNDVFTVGANQDLSFNNKALGSHGFNGSYSVPWGYWTATLSGNTNTYYTNIAAVNDTFVSSGNSQTAAFRIARVLSRSQADVFGAYMQLSKRFGESFIEGTTIPIQNRNNTFIELGTTDRHYFGGAQFDGTLAYRQGIHGLGATGDPNPDLYSPSDETTLHPTYLYKMAILDTNLSIPFAIASQT